MTSGNADIICPECGYTNRGGTLFCAKCNTPVDDFQTVGASLSRSTDDESTALADITPNPPLERGTRLAAGRYEILKILGQGGMGAVYKARDHELDREVAVKVIVPELVNSKAILRRFKQELLLARQVTHKNVVRIFDIGESDGMKFITMEYVDGSDLKSHIVQRGKIPAQEAVGIVQQICHALAAAHSEGVIHRDLKPQNIMIDQNGRVVVMDFGIAHSQGGPGMTMTGALMGTPEYMSPEQAKGEKVDVRSDIYSLGLVFYEMLVGTVPFHAPTAVETIFRRTQESAIPPAEIDSSIPAQANKVVVKCLETSPSNRYQSIQELLADLAAFDPGKKIGAVERLASRLRRRSIPWKPVAALAAGLALALTAIQIRQRAVPALPEAPHQGMQVLIADFTAPDPTLEGAVEPMLGLALEGASFISNADRGRARSEGMQVRREGTRLDESLAVLVALRDGIDVVISGSISQRGSGYRISAKATRAATQKTIIAATADATGKSDVAAAVGKLASSLRTALGDTSSPDSKLAQTETLSTTSFEAFQTYAQAQELRSSGKWEEAIRYYTRALQLDPDLGRAYAGIAAAYANTGQYEQAEKNYKLALAHIDRMTERERHRTLGGYYLLTREPDKAADEFKALVTQYPADTAGRSGLALSLFLKRDFTGALVQGIDFVKAYPSNAPAVSNVALYAMYAGDFETANRQAGKALELNPGFVKGYLAKAIAAQAQNQVDEAMGFYEKAKGINTTGASLAAAGLADIALYEGRTSDAEKILEDGAATDIANNDRSSASDKLATLATIYSEIKDRRQAIAVAQRSAAGGDEDSILYRVGRVYITSGERTRAIPLITQLSSKLQPDSRAYAKLLEGELLLADKNPRMAIDRFHEAQMLADTWLGHFALGRAYLDAIAFAEASSEFDTCLKRRGEATAVFLDDRPTYHLIPEVLYYQARSQEGLRNAGAVDEFKAFLTLKRKADKDPLAEDAKKRLR